MVWLALMWIIFKFFSFFPYFLFFYFSLCWWPVLGDANKGRARFTLPTVGEGLDKAAHARGQRGPGPLPKPDNGKLQKLSMLVPTVPHRTTNVYVNDF